MSIVKMKRLRLIALARDRDELLSSLLHAGCVEVSEPPADLADPLLRRDKARVAEAKSELAELKQALSVLRRQAPQKEGLLTPRQVVRERDLLDHGAMAAALEKARTVNDHAKAAGQCSARETRLNAELQSLRPWEACDLPLNEAGTRCVAVLLGTVPSAVDFDAMAGAVSEAAEASQVTLLSADGQQQCLEVLVHRSQEGAALEALRSYGFSLPQFKDASGTARDNVRRLEEEMEAVRAQRQAELDAIRAMGPETGALKLCVDQVQQVLATEETKERILAGGSILCLDGWVDEPNVSKLEQALAAFDCAWELTDPAPEEYPKVPVKLQNGPLTRCMNMVTEMYALPVYGTVDPNPLMAPFFILFYGIMMADMGYGLLMVLGAVFMIKKMRARGGMRNFAELLFYCGISTFVIGAHRRLLRGFPDPAHQHHQPGHGVCPAGPLHTHERHHRHSGRVPSAGLHPDHHRADRQLCGEDPEGPPDGRHLGRGHLVGAVSGGGAFGAGRGQHRRVSGGADYRHRDAGGGFHPQRQGVWQDRFLCGSGL